MEEMTSPVSVLERGGGDSEDHCAPSHKPSQGLTFCSTWMCHVGWHHSLKDWHSALLKRGWLAGWLTARNNSWVVLRNFYCFLWICDEST